MAATYSLQIDWYGNGFTGGPDDVTARVLDQRTAPTMRTAATRPGSSARPRRAS
jgi:hypothetical protein